MNEVVDPALPRYLKLSEIVPHLIPVGKATLWRWIQRGTFPAPKKLVARPRLWLRSEVVAWMNGTWSNPSKVHPWN